MRKLLKNIRVFRFLCVCLGSVFFSNIALADPSHGLSRFGSLQYEKGFSHFSYANPNAPKGGEVRYAAIGSFDNLNPHILKGVAASGIGLIYDTLMVSSKDELFSSYGLIAESVEVAEDKKSVTYILRQEAVWHDQTPITPDDVVFSYHTILEKGHPYYKSYYRDIVDVVKTGDRSVRFDFAHGNNPELPMITGQFPIVSKAYYSQKDFGKTSLEPPLGNGAYTIKDIKAGQSITYERVKNYWAADLGVNKGRHNFDHIHYDYYRDRIVASEAFKAGAYDIHQENTAKFWAKNYNDLKALEDGSLIKREIQHDIPTGMQAFLFNARQEKFKDVQVRKALNHILDFEWTNKQLFFNAYHRTESYFSNSVFSSKGSLPSAAEKLLLEPYKDQLPESLWTTPFALMQTDGSGNNRTQLREASRLLTEAGYRVVDKKRRLLDGTTPFTIEFLMSSPAFERVIAPMVKNLERLGVDASMRLVDSTQYEKRLEDFDFDMTVFSYGQSNAPGNEQIDYWHSSKAQVKGSRNYIGIENKVVDALIEAVIAAENKEDLITATRALDRVLLWHYYVIPNWHIRSFRLLHWNKFGYPQTNPKFDLGLDTWWSKEADS